MPKRLVPSTSTRASGTGSPEVAVTRPQMLPIRPRELELRVVLQDHHVVAREPRLHLADAIEVHDRAAMDARELLGIEQRLDRAQRLANEMGRGARMHAHVVALR